MSLRLMLLSCLLVSFSATMSAVELKDFHLHLRKMAVELVLPPTELSQIAEKELRNLVIETNGIKLEVKDIKLEFQKGFVALTSNVKGTGTANLGYFSKKIDTDALVQSEIEFVVRDGQINAKVINLQLKTSDASLNSMLAFAGPVVRSEFEKHLNNHFRHLFGAKTLKEVSFEHVLGFAKENGIQKVPEDLNISAIVTEEGLDLSIELTSKSRL